MIRMNKITSILSKLFDYIKRFDPYNSHIEQYRIYDIYRLIQRSNKNGADLISYFCSALTNARMNRGVNTNSDYKSRIQEWNSMEKKINGMKSLKLLFLNVYGKEGVSKEDNSHNNNNYYEGYYSEEYEEEEVEKELEQYLDRFSPRCMCIISISSSSFSSFSFSFSSTHSASTVSSLSSFRVYAVLFFTSIDYRIYC